MAASAPKCNYQVELDWHEPARFCGALAVATYRHWVTGERLNLCDLHATHSRHDAALAAGWIEEETPRGSR